MIDVRLDIEMQGRVIDSLVLRGDISLLNPQDRARYYIEYCQQLGLNPVTQPLAILRLNGKEVLYPTKGATDQLAALHKLTREVIDGPRVIDLAGTKLVYCVCKATHPNGRTETAVATVPLTDPVNVLMKCETKGKRRVTLSILGLGMLDESELETIPAASKSEGTPIDLGVLDAKQNEPTKEAPAVPSGAVSITSVILARLAKQMETEYEKHPRGHAECWRENLRLLEEEFEHADIQSAKIKFTSALVMARFKFWDETALPLVHDENAPTVFWPLYKDLRDAKDDGALVLVWNTHKAVVSKLESKEHREIAWDMACYRYGELHAESTTPPKTAFKKLLTPQPPPDGTTDTGSRPATPPASAQGSAAEGAQGGGAQASVSYLPANSESARYVASATEWEARCARYEQEAREKRKDPRILACRSWAKHAPAFRAAGERIYEARLHTSAEYSMKFFGSIDADVVKIALKTEERTAEANARKHAEAAATLRKAG